MPFHEIGRRGGHDVALPVLEVPPISAVFLAHRVPKGEVLRIEGPLGDQRPVGQGLPAEPVRRAERRQPVRLPRADDRLVPGIRRAVGVGVLEHGDVSRVGLDRAVLARGQHDVVLLRPLELEQPHVRLFPMNPVGTLRVTGIERMRLCQLVVLDGQLPRLVVHAVPSSRQNHSGYHTAIAVPGQPLYYRPGHGGVHGVEARTAARKRAAARKRRLSMGARSVRTTPEPAQQH